MYDLKELQICTKIQNLMNNIKEKYNDKISFTANSADSLIKNNKNSDHETFSSFSQNSLSDCDDLPYSNNFTIRHINVNNNDLFPWKKEKQLSENIKNSETFNFIPLQILFKIETLEKLIFSTKETLENSPNGADLDLKLSKLILDIKGIKSKIEIGTKQILNDAEIVKLMKKLATLFEIFNNIQEEINEKETKNCFEFKNQNNLNENYFDYFPQPEKEKRNLFISNITSNSDDILFLNQKSHFSENNISNKNYDFLTNSQSATNISTTKNPQLKQNFFSKIYNPQNTNSVEIKNSCDNCYTNNYLNFYQFGKMKSCNALNFNKMSNEIEPPKTKTEVDNLIFDLSEKINKNLEKKPKIRQSLNDFLNIPSNTFKLNKSSKLPILKKENVNDSELKKTAQISFMSQTIANKVYNNLHKIGYNPDIITQLRTETYHTRSKSDSFIKCLKSRTRIKKRIPPLPKEEDRLYKSYVTSLYLTKLGSVRFNKLSETDFFSKGCFKHARIFSLESLLQENKYKFVDENIPIKSNSENISKKFEVENNSSLNLSLSPDKEKSNQRKKNVESDMVTLMSLAGNSIKIVHQIILFPTKPLEMSSIENLPKNPRLVHIESICDCKINILNRNECSKRKIKYLKDRKVIEIHYDLRKGKALGCINLLLQLAGSLTHSMIIYRTSIILPGGYLKEMTTTSISELLDLSFQNKENIKYFRSKT